MQRVVFNISLFIGIRSVEGLAFAKYSSACLPPEAIVRLDDGTYIIRAFIEDLASGVAVPLFGRSYSLLQADPSHDMWALGALLCGFSPQIFFYFSPPDLFT
jgi:hypothetical protein